MSLELRKSSNWWYGVFLVNGRKTIVNLKVPITGKRPPKRTMHGDDEFEQSRALESMPTANAPALPSPASAEEVRARVDAYLTKLGESKRAARLRAVFDAYAGGSRLDQVMATTVFSRGAVSNYLNELERETGTSIARDRRRAPKTDALQEEREVGLRRASLHDFHSFRVTWVTLALAAGVPLELVQRVTGHRTVAVVLKH